jgi:cob(I)alamin adenosyltransferase
MDYSELNAGKYLPGFTIKQYGRNCFIYKNPAEEDIRDAQAGLKECSCIMESGDYDLVVMDEINIALHYGLVKAEDIMEALDRRSTKVEIVMTGRYAKDEIIEKADLVTEMKEVKHYYRTGLMARVGIEK